MMNTRNRAGAAIIVAALVVCGSLTASQAMADEPEHAAIEAAVRDYIDGWYEGDAARMERALHSDLAKRAVRAMQGGIEILDTASASNMIAYTAAGFGKDKLPADYVNQVTIIEATERIAMVKTVSPDFVDYIHVAKIGGAWKIVNVLWEPVEE